MQLVRFVLCQVVTHLAYRWPRFFAMDLLRIITNWDNCRPPLPHTTASYNVEQTHPVHWWRHHSCIQTTHERSDARRASDIAASDTLSR